MNKKRMLILISLVVMSVSMFNTLNAQDRTFGIGGIINGPDGVTVKLRFSESTAIAGAVSFGLSDEYSWFLIQADFLKENHIVTWEEAMLHFYFGAGARIISNDIEDEFAVRAPFGINVNIADAPVEVFFEVVPYADLDPEFYFSFGGAFGFRYYF